MNPKKAFENRTARLLAEGAHKPRVAYTSSQEAAAARRQAEVARQQKAADENQVDFYARAEDLACGKDFCHICERPTDHRGEHTPEQILDWAMRPGMVQSLLNLERFDV